MGSLCSKVQTQEPEQRILSAQTSSQHIAIRRIDSNSEQQSFRNPMDDSSYDQVKEEELNISDTDCMIATKPPEWATQTLMSKSHFQSHEVRQVTSEESAVPQQEVQVQEVQQKILEGYGEITLENGCKYTGQFKDGKANGRGKIIINGDIYEGTFINDKIEGEGVYIYKRGPKYEGQFKNHKQHGHGIETWTDGSCFEGEFKNGRKDGMGTYIWANGCKYTGEWKDNVINGFGKYEWPDQRSYEGEWSRNQMHGRGKYVWKDGKCYDGEYDHDKKKGFGIFSWPDGNVYQGYWLDGKQHGKGLLIAKDGKNKYGEWAQGKLISYAQDQQVNIIPAGWKL